MASAALNSASLIECVRPSTSAREKLAIMPWLAREALAGVGAGIAAGERDDPGHARVLDQRRIEIRNIRDRQLEHHLAAVRQRVEAFGSARRAGSLRRRPCPGS